MARETEEKRREQWCKQSLLATYMYMHLRGANLGAHPRRADGSISMASKSIAQPRDMHAAGLDMKDAKACISSSEKVCPKLPSMRLVGEGCAGLLECRSSIGNGCRSHADGTIGATGDVMIARRGVSK